MTLWHVFRIRTGSNCCLKYLSVQFSRSVMSDSAATWTAVHQASGIFAAYYLQLLGSANVCLEQDQVSVL